MTDKIGALIVVEDGKRRFVEGEDLAAFVDEHGVARVQFCGIGIPARLWEDPAQRDWITSHEPFFPSQ